MPNKPIALITGGAQRIGKELTRTFHQLGYNIALHYNRSEQAATDLKSELESVRKNSIFLYQCDLANTDDVIAFSDRIFNQHKNLKLLINNASAFLPTSLAELSSDHWDTLINSNLKAPFFLAAKLKDSLIRNKGSIINMIDIHAERPMPNHSTYSIAKAGLAMATKALAHELAPDVRVNGIAPGAILWPTSEMDNQPKQKQILEKTALKRSGDASDICSIAKFLAEDAPYITGQIIAVDGGRTLNL